MNSVRTILNEIKKIRGIANDTQLAGQIGVPVHTLRSWIQNDSIRRQLIVYCEQHDLSLDEVMFNKKKVHQDHCENCRQKESCNEYRNVVEGPLTIGEGQMEPRTVVFNTDYSASVRVELHDDIKIRSNCLLDLDGIDRLVVKLQSPAMDMDAD